MAEVIPLGRPPREARRAKLGMTLFLASWAVTFIALFIGCGWIRLRAPAWPPPGAPAMPILAPTVCSILAVTSSAAMQLGLWGVVQARRAAAQRALVVAAILGVAFLGVQLVSWVDLWQAGLRLERRAPGMPWAPQVAYAGCFFALTGFHAAHVVTGLGVLAGLSPGLRRWRYTPRDHLPVRFAVWFWHFVTVAWFGVWFVAYSA
jgi:cytochrome c oxidase subunit 3